MAFINCNGKIVEDSTPIIDAQNRGFKYGDGLFETFKFKNNQLILLDEHLARLWNGMRLFEFQIPKLFNPDFLESQILQLIQKNKLTLARIRLTVYRGPGSLFDPLHHHPQFIIETGDLPENNGQLNINGLHCCIYRDAFKIIDTFSNCKHNNYLPYMMGALYAKKEKCNDAIILNQHKNICDSSIANIFIIKNESIYTPSLKEGCIAGIMRQQIIKELNLLNYSVNEKTIDEAELMDADEVFLTNSIFNIKWVKSINEKKYENRIIQTIYQELVKTNSPIFC